MALSQSQHSLQGVSVPWKRARRNSKTCLLDLGPPLRVPVDETDANDSSSTYPSTSPHPHGQERVQEDKNGLAGTLLLPQLARLPPAKSRAISHSTESHTGSNMSQVENGVASQPPRHEGSHTSDKIMKNPSVPNLHHHLPSYLPPHPPSHPPPPHTRTHPSPHPPPPSHQPPSVLHPPPYHHPHPHTHPSPHPPPPSHQPPSVPHPHPHTHPSPHPPPPPASHHPPPPPPPRAPSSHLPPNPSPCPPQTVSPPSFLPTKPDDVVVMTAGEERRNFRKIGLLGRGGSSKVYKVFSEECEIFALKEVYLKYVDNAVKHAYITEINFLKRLKQVPEVITLHFFSWDKNESILYLLLEYAETDLAAIMKTQKPSIPRALYFWNEMLGILAIIHDEGIIHNDLKPENFVCIKGSLKLIDFGIANRIEDEHTSVNRDLCCGTISYMSPETIETHEDKAFYKVGRPSDVWSLGCILYQMLYGRTPFDSYGKKLQKLQAIINPAASIPFPDIDHPAAVDIMKKCLTRNPKDRPTVKDLLSHPFTLSKALH